MSTCSCRSNWRTIKQSVHLCGITTGESKRCDMQAVLLVVSASLGNTNMYDYLKFEHKSLIKKVINVLIVFSQ